jgi:hypothetical protein
MRPKIVQPNVNSRAARKLWGELPRTAIQALRRLTEEYRFSVLDGDISRIDGKWYVTHSGLLRLAARGRCVAITVHPVTRFCDAATGRWVFRAVVHKSGRSRGFCGYGDADPSNVSSLVRGAEMRIAETRAVNRALRKAYGIGLCSVEELGYLTSRPDPPSGNSNGRTPVNGSGSNGHSRLRDRLCLLIRQHQLDPGLVKRYAADFCGTEELRNATRESVESFITHVANCAARDRAGLVCKLNSYAPVEEVQR